MAVKRFNTRIQLKNDAATGTSGWLSDAGSNLVLLKGEFAWDSTNKNFKIGTGGTATFSSLDYAIPTFDSTYFGSSVVNHFNKITLNDLATSKITKLTGYSSTTAPATITDETSLNEALKKITSDLSQAAVLSNLNVDGYAQASASAGSIVIYGIKEENGLISADSSNNITINIADNYDATTNKLATVTTVTAALGTLDTTSDVAPVEISDATTGKTLTFKGVKEVDGIISQGTGTSSVTIGDGALKLSGYGETTTGDTPSISEVSATNIFTANDTEDKTISLSNGFILDATNKTIGIRTNQAVAANNNIATMNDIASLSGAMHYGGAMASDSEWPSSTTPGDTFVVTTGFTHSGTTLEAGDMVVFGENDTYNVVQSNMTLGVSQGQIATNSAALTNGNIVVASGTGIETSSYTIANIASEAVAVTESSGTITVSDTLTVGGTAQTAQSFTITGGNGITASASGNAITVSHSTTTAVDASAVKVGKDQYGHVVLGDALASTDIAHTATIGTTNVTTVDGAIDALQTLAEGSVQEVVTLKTSSTGQSKTPSGESLEVSTGHTEVVLHDIAKTGNTDDLIQGLTILLDCGTATTITDTEA